MHLFLSPHLDDAVLSCGGTIHQLAAQGEAVSVLTIMAGDPPEPLPDTAIVADLHQRWQAGFNPVATRRAEDEQACALLGAKAIHWELGDCVYRVVHKGGLTTALYPSEESLWGDIHPDDLAPAALRESVVASQPGNGLMPIVHNPQKLRGPISLPLPTHLYIPLGNRHHVDHRIVRDWGLWLGEQHPSVTLLLYEEYPYEIDATMELGRALAYFASQKMDLTTRALDEADVAAKLDAIACHQSQISTFWPGLDAMAQQTRESMLAAGNGIYAERFWRMI